MFILQGEACFVKKKKIFLKCKFDNSPVFVNFNEMYQFPHLHQGQYAGC